MKIANVRFKTPDRSFGRQVRAVASAEFEGQAMEGIKVIHDRHGLDVVLPSKHPGRPPWTRLERHIIAARVLLEYARLTEK